MNTDPGKMVWRDVSEFVKAAYLDRSEYFSSNVPAKTIDEEIWSKGYPCAYWLVGGSEGWYVHVARNFRRPGEKPIHEDLLIGKFWRPDDASFAADLVSRFMNGAFKSVEQLLAEGRARFG